jgi:hypothetical protein
VNDKRDTCPEISSAGDAHIDATSSCQAVLTDFLLYRFFVYDDDDDDPDDDSIEAMSTIDGTLSVRTRSRFTDFALVYWLEKNTVNPEKDDEDFLIDQEFIAALIEIKRSASRKLAGERPRELLCFLRKKRFFNR